MMNKMHRGQQGFTLIEIIVVVAVIAVLAGISTLAFQGLLGRYQLQREARTIFSEVQRAKVEAARRGQRVAFQITPGVGNAGQFTVFVTNNLWANVGPVLNTFQMSTGHQIAAAFGGNTTAGFDPRGLPAAGRIGTITVSEVGAGRTYTITVGLAGSVRLQ